MIVVARHSGVSGDRGVDRRAAATAFAFERSTAAVAFDVHLEDGGVMDEAVDDSHGHCLVGEDLAPFAEGLIGGDQLFGDVSEVIEDQEVVFIKLGKGSFESKLAAGDLQTLDEIGSAGEQRAPAVFDEGEAESCCQMTLASTGRPEQQQIGAIDLARISHMG
jgi:hypothetical protein